MNRDCKIERKINTPKVTQDWITCASGFHSRGCDVYVNTTILKTHMDLLIRESLCRQEKKKDFLNSLLTNGGGDVTSEESEEFTEYTSASLPTQKASSKNSEYTSTEDTQNIGQTFGSGGDVDVAPIVEKVPLTDPPVPEVKLTPTNSVSRTEDDLKEMLVAGLDSGEQSSVSKTTSSYQPTVAANLPQAADTTDGSAGFNSGGDVADITSDVPETPTSNGIPATQGPLHVYTEQPPTQSLHPKALQPDLPSQSQQGPEIKALDTDTPAFNGEFASGGDPVVYSNEPTIKIPPQSSSIKSTPATPYHVDPGATEFNSGGDVDVGDVKNLDDLTIAVQPESQAAGATELKPRVATDQHVPGANDVIAMMNPDSIEQQTINGGAYSKSRKRISSSSNANMVTNRAPAETQFVQPVPIAETLRKR